LCKAGENPSEFSRTGRFRDKVQDISDADLKRFPVEAVSWENCKLFVAKLNRREQVTGWVYRLPKETEWEYACRGGPMSDRLDSAFNFYFAKPTNTLLPEQANFKHDKGLDRPCKVGSYEPNRLGLFDMHGNVAEWCDDTVVAADGTSRRVLRNGGWHVDSGNSRAFFSWPLPPSDRHGGHGLRLARVPVDAKTRD
jgi:eukaryotic-like serine/threonine-protein kinase